MSLVTVVLIGLVIWFLVLVAIILAFGVANRRLRPHQLETPKVARAPDRRVAGDRRGGRDRRIGLPDPRPLQLERRPGRDRRDRGIAA